MIEEIYLIKALNIRKKFNSIMRRVNNYEIILQDLSKTIDLTQNKLDDVLVELDESKIDSPEIAKDKFLKILMELESEAVTTEKFMNDIDEQVKELQNEENELFKEIKNIYPTLSDSQIKSEVQNYLKKFNLS